MNGYLQTRGVANSTVFFPSHEEQADAFQFSSEGLSLLLVNVEEEQTMRRGDIFREEQNGRSRAAHPEIRLNLYLLFVAYLPQYDKSMDLLSLVIAYFQSRRVFTPDRYPQLGEAPAIEKLTAELVTLPFAQQNEVWNALRTSYKPSLLYKVRMVVFTDEAIEAEVPTITEIDQRMTRT